MQEPEPSNHVKMVFRSALSFQGLTTKLFATQNAISYSASRKEGINSKSTTSQHFFFSKVKHQVCRLSFNTSFHTIKKILLYQLLTSHPKHHKNNNQPRAIILSTIKEGKGKYEIPHHKLLTAY